MARRGYLTYKSRSWDFMTVRVPDHTTRWAELITRDIATEGLDGTLTVNLHRRFSPFRVIFTSSYASLATAAQQAEDLKAIKGYFAKMRIELFGNPREWANIKIAQAMATARPDTGGGPYTVSGHAAVMRGIITVVPTELPIS